jgi:hypothetical protein
VGSAGGGGGTVTSVVGTDPIDAVTVAGAVTVSISPATEADAGSMSAADKTKLDGIAVPFVFWDFDGTGIPAAQVTPELNQKQAIAGPGQRAAWRTQAAATGSNAVGGFHATVLGASDGTGAGTGTFIYWGESTVAAGGDPWTSTNVFGFGILKRVAGGTIILNLGLGTNGLGAGVAGTEIAAFTTLSIATENNSPIRLQPASGSGGQAFFSFEQDGSGGPNGPPVLRITDGVTPSAASGVIRFNWGESSGSSYGLVVQRDAGDTQDFQWLSRHFGEMYFGTLAENNRYHAHDRVLFELLSNGQGYVFDDAAGSAVAAFASDTSKTWMQGSGSYPVVRDAWISQRFHRDTTSTAAAQQLAVISPSGGAGGTFLGTQLKVDCVGVDETTGDFVTFEIDYSVMNIAGVLTFPTQPQVVEHYTSSAGAGTLVAPTLVIVGATVELRGTPWTTNLVHWVARAQQLTNVGTF